MPNFQPLTAAQALGLTQSGQLTTTNPLISGVAQTPGLNDLIPNNFQVVSNLNGGDNSLPASKVPDFRVGEFKRNLVHFFVSSFGVVKLYVNPQNITINYSKLISKDRTKGGYSVQYWGENLTELNISGTTGSSGYEGINVLEQVYRAEQYAFDTIGLSLAADNAILGATNNILDGIGGAIASTVGSAVGNQTVGGITGAGIANGILGANNMGTFAPRNIPSLAQLAFTVEMYYNGLIFRGFFESFNVVERSDSIGLLEYTMRFISTQKRGYRLNTLPWQRSAIDGPSNNSIDGGIPFSYLRST